MGKKPICGHEKAKIKPLKTTKNNLVIIFYKYYDIFADMNIIIRNIPNTITMLNLVCGLISIYCSFEKRFTKCILFYFLWCNI